MFRQHVIIICRAIYHTWYSWYATIRHNHKVIHRDIKNYNTKNVHRIKSTPDSRKSNWTIPLILNNYYARWSNDRGKGDEWFCQYFQMGNLFTYNWGMCHFLTFRGSICWTRGKTKLSSYAKVNLMGVNHIKFSYCKWGSILLNFTVSITFYSKLYRKLCTSTKILKINEGQLTPIAWTCLRLWSLFYHDFFPCFVYMWHLMETGVYLLELLFLNLHLCDSFLVSSF